MLNKGRRLSRMPLWVFLLPWCIWGVATLGVPYQFALQSSTSVMIPMLMDVFHTNKAGVGFLTSVFFYSYLLFQVPAGMLIDQFGARWVLTVSIALCGGACLLFAYAPNLAVAQVSRILMGLVMAPAVPAAMTTAANWFKPQRFVMVAGLSESIGMMGGAIGEVSFGSLVTHCGWQQTLIVCAIIGFSLALIMGICVRNKPSASHRKLYKLPAIKLSGTSEQNVVKGFLTVMKDRQAWMVALYGGMIFAFLPALAGLWIVPFLQASHHVSLQAAALGSSVIFTGAAIGLPCWGWLSECVGRRKPVMAFATSMTLVITAAFLFIPSLPLWSVYFLLFLMGYFAAVYILTFTLMREITCPKVRGSAMGFNNMMTMIIGAPLLQPLIGFILHRTHENYLLSFLTLLVCLILALCILFCIRETYCREQYQ